MSEFNIRADSVNVEEIMRQIRTRIRVKRGVDYTEEQIRELATVQLERFLDPEKVRSELLQQFRQASAAPNYAFEDHTLFETHRPLLRLLRRVLRPVLKLFFNPDPLVQALHIQSGLNTRLTQQAELGYEVLHNLVVELTRLGIETKNLKMRVESLSSRLDFHERRTRALEGIVQYRPGSGAAAPGAAEHPAEAGPSPAPSQPGDTHAESRSRRRRRRRGRRGSPTAPAGDHQDTHSVEPDAPAGRDPQGALSGAERRDPAPGDGSGPDGSGR